jgi:predicted nucleic acid-binding protein
MSQRYVIDANVLFSAFISGKDLYHLLFSEHTIYLPDFAFLEMEQYKARILQKTQLKEREFQEFVLTLFRNVTVIPNFLLSQASLKRAYQLCRDIDEKDTLYVAVALEFHVTLITNDKTLYRGLKKQHFRHVTLLGDVMNTLPINSA